LEGVHDPSVSWAENRGTLGTSFPAFGFLSLGISKDIVVKKKFLE